MKLDYLLGDLNGDVREDVLVEVRIVLLFRLRPPEMPHVVGGGERNGEEVGGGTKVVCDVLRRGVASAQGGLERVPMVAGRGRGEA